MSTEIKKLRLSNGEIMAYRERSGGEEVIILLHGNMTSSKHWDVLMSVLDPRFKVYAVDLRGFGNSSYKQPITSIKDFSDDLKLFVEELSLKKFSLVGWSTGGAIAMQYSIDFSDDVEKIVLLASASTRGYPIYAMNEDGTPNLHKRLQTLLEIENDSRTVMMQGMNDRKDRDGLKEVWNAVIYTDRRPDERKYDEYIDDMLTQRNLKDVYHALNIFNISGHYNGVVEGMDTAKTINAPVLVLYGDRDFVVTEDMTKELLEDLNHIAIPVQLKDTGHSAMIDNLDRLKIEIENFLK